MTNLRSRTLVILIILFSALPLYALKVFPLLSYSSSSGLLIGGIMSHNMIPPFSPFGFSTMAYIYTDGSISAEPQLLFKAGSGIVRFNINYNVSRGNKFFGWGNRGDNELYESYDSETQEVSGSYNFTPLSGIIFTGGLLSRHSTIYNRLNNQFWEQSPTDKFGSLWTAGPSMEGIWIIPSVIDGYFKTGYDLQLADNISYYNTEFALSVFAPVGTSTVPCFRTRITRHGGTDSTPFPYLPSLGGNSGLRGYNDARFGGNWSLLGNLELRQRIFTYTIDEDNSMSLSLVLFGDAGQVADHLSEFKWSGFHFDGGLGARITLPGGSSLRADFALSPEGLGIQMGLGELF